MVFNVKDSLEFINSKKEYIQIASDLFQIYNRNLMPQLVKRLDRDLQGEASRFEAKSRLSPINILPKIVNKLSNVYRVTVQRDPTAGLSEIELGSIVKTWELQTALQMANRMLNLHRCVAIEPVPQTNKLRVIPANKFLVRGDGTIDNNMIEFIKIIGNDVSRAGQSVTLYQSYTYEEFVTYDSDGNVLENIPNDYGIIPIVYATRDCVTLLPEEDKDTLSMVTLLPILLSDLNFALKFQCFSIIYAMNIESKNMQLAPNAVWFFSSKNEDKAELGTIKPTVAVDDMLKAVQTQYSLWLESRGIKMNSLENDTSGTLSGIAKAIDQADVTDDIVYQRDIFTIIEAQIFKIIGLFNERNFEVSSSFQETTVMPETPTEKINRIVIKLNNKLMSWDAAVREANNHMSEPDLETMKAKILLETNAKNEGKTNVVPNELERTNDTRIETETESPKDLP